MTCVTEQRSVNDGTRVRLHPLRIRGDGAEWVVGRVETGDFVAVGADGERAIRLLDCGLAVAAVRDRLRAQQEVELDVAEFVSALVDLGFVAALDEHPLDQPAPPAPTLAWLRPRHVGWTLHPLTGLIAAAIMLAGAGALAARPALLPRYHDLLWSKTAIAVIIGNAALAWTILFVHELGHLCTARAAGVPARITLSTRLQFLVAQTDVTGIWAARRRTRFAVYLAGLAVELTLTAAAILVRALTPVHSTTNGLAGAFAAISLLGIAPQFLIFTRTDLYYVLQDLAGTRNLYADGSSYLRYRTARLLRPLKSRGGTDPSRALPAGERRAVRGYAAILLFGSAACLAVASAITLPATGTLVAGAIHTMLGAQSGGSLIDGAATLLVIGAVPTLWARAWWLGHSQRVRAAVRTISARPRQSEGGESR